MTARVARAAEMAVRPWPNGLGVTRDLASGPGWQLGVAELGGAAAFSDFPGMDRVFTLLSGEAVLVLEGRGALPCRALVPAGFPGDVPCHYRPAGGAARAFNVIVERGRWAARVSVLSVAGSRAAAVAGVAVFCAEGAVEVGGVRLGAGDAVLHPAGTVRALGGAAVAILVGIEAVSGEPRAEGAMPDQGRRRD